MMDRRTREERIEALPKPLRDLVRAELAAGNEIVELSGLPPAPPAGLCARLAREVTTRPRTDFDGIRFYERCSPSHSGEFFDAERMNFVVEPPKDPRPPPDMNAIRGDLERAEREADAKRYTFEW